MIEEVAVVSSVKDFQVSVLSTQMSSCGKCVQKDACSTSLLEKYIGRREIVVDTDLPLACGDKVLIGIDEGALIKGSIVLYIAPLLALILGGGVGEFVAGFLNYFSADLLAAVVAFVFFITSLAIIRNIQQYFVVQYFTRPIVIRKL